jgi:hypothetical protein
MEAEYFKMLLNIVKYLKIRQKYQKTMKEKMLKFSVGRLFTRINNFCDGELLRKLL